MVKKARKAKKAKKAKAASSKSGRPMPTYYQGKKPVDIPVHRVADVIAMIHDQGHGAKFKRQAKAANISMSVDPKTINFVKDFVANNELHAHPVGKQVINSDGTFSCT